MDSTRTDLPNNEIKFTITLSPEEVAPFLVTAAHHVSEHMDIAGFRKGKATYEAVLNNVGAMAVYEEALEPIVRLHVQKVLMDEALDTVGTPKVDVEKMVPDQELVFSVTVTRMPSVTKLASYKDVQVAVQSIEPKEKDVARAIKDLTSMRTKEVRANADVPVGDTSLCVVDLRLTRDGVPIEGGSSPDFRLYMNEDVYVPGMKDVVRGLKEGESRSAPITFPADYGHKPLAGQTVQADVTIKEVFELQVPEADDAFAKTLGLESLEQLREKISENLKAENQQEEDRRQEREVLEALVAASTFEVIPESLVDDEVSKMMHELEHAVERQGGVFADYLTSIKKSPQELRDGMKDQALLRVRVALLLNEVAKREGLEVTKDEVGAEVERQLSGYKEEEHETRERIQSEEYKRYLAHKLRNEKAVAFVRKACVA